MKVSRQSPQRRAATEHPRTALRERSWEPTRQHSWVAQREDGGPDVLVTGLPGSGNSTLAVALSDALDLPLLAKDDLGDVLFDALGTARDEPLERNAGIPWLRPGRAVPALRWAGVAFIAAGIFLVSRTPHGR